MGKVGTEETLQKILAAVGTIAKINTDFSNFDQIADVVRRGIAPEVFNVGDQIITTYTDAAGKTYNMPFDVVDFKDVTLESGSIAPGMILQSHYATIESIQFDAPEPDRPASEDYSGQIAQYGWNRWAYSGVRQWLNSTAAKGEWWTPQNDYDVAPSQLASVNGFMAGLPADFLAVLKPVRVETVTNYRWPSMGSGTYEYDETFDTFFLPSREEEYITANEPNHREGTAWQYWIDRLTPEALRAGEAVPQNIYASADVTHALKAHIRYALENHTSAQTVRLRSAYRTSASYVWYANSAGYAYYASAYSSYRSAPACVIC